MGKPLYVTFVDLSNAFPSTDQALLWLKLLRRGATGPMFDWLRKLYRDMSYVVARGGQHTDAFQSTVGILAGDSASPGLLNIYF